MSTSQPGSPGRNGIRVRLCLLTLHDGVYFATREMGTLFETERYIHNYALSYALFNDDLIRVPYFVPSHRPRYAEDLNVLNQAGVYVTPARPLEVDYQFITYKIAQVTYHQRAERFDRPNYPRNIGRVKELAPGSRFEFVVFGDTRRDDGTEVSIPRWIRLGKWMSKAEIRVDRDEHLTPRSGEFVCRHPVNPLDLGSVRLGVFNIVSMPPVSLIENAQLTGEYVTVGVGRQAIDLPFGMRYAFPPEVYETGRA